MAEIDIQQAFRKRLYYTAPRVRVVAIPNAGKRSQWAAAQAKKEGLAKGFPDVVCLWPGAGIAFVEFKDAKGRVSIDQTEWHEWLDESGHRVAVARTPEDAIAFLRNCGAPIMEQAA